LMSLKSSDLLKVSRAVEVLKAGGVIAYPTEYCFGLGCDPRNESAVAKLLDIKQRKAEQGVILIAADIEQVELYADLARVPDLSIVTSSWPGPNTWLLPAKPKVPSFIRGRHTSIAMRIPDHALCQNLLNAYGHPIVSTSANRTGEKEHLTASTVERDMGVECDYIVDAPVGGASRASRIRDALSGCALR